MTGRSIERRKAPRAPADFSIRLADRGEAREARVKDLSTHGLCCWYPEPVAEMTLVRLDLELPGQGAHEVQGAVVRCQKVRGQSPPTYEVAVYFTRVPAECRAALAQYVTTQLAAADSRAP
jgi:hypothetical protein